MRTNWFQYHVQNRDYTPGEVLSLLNDKPYKHYVLSGKSYFYSLGTTAEIFEPIKNLAVGTVSWVGSTAWSITSAIFKATIIKAVTSLTNFSYNEGDTYIIENNTYNVNDSKFKITDLRNEKYSGEEVTKFLNEYYDKSIFFSNEEYYQDALSNFIYHGNKGAEVPTLGNHSFFDIAVLDIE